MSENDFQDSDWVGDEAPTSIPDITITDLDTLCQKMVDARAKCADLEQQKSKASAEKKAYELKFIEIMEQLGKTRYLSKAGAFGLSGSTAVAIPKGDNWQKFKEYIATTGELDALLSVNSKTLNKWYKDRFEEAKERGEGVTFSVPGIAEPKILRTVSFSKAK